MIKLKNILSEASLKGVEGVPSNKKLSQLSDNDKLKIVQSTGNLISFKVPDWSKGKRNFWTVISNGKIVQKKNLDGITIFILPGKGPEKVSPSYSSVKDLLNGVDWDTMELRRESVNEAAMNPVKKVVNAILKKNGVNAMKTTSTSVKGFHNIQNGGYRYDSDYFLSFYKVPQDIVKKVGAEMEKAGVRGVEVKNGMISADFSKTGMVKRESVKEAAFKSPDYIVTSIPADAIPPVNISKADVGLGLSMFDVLGRGWTLNNKDYKLDYHNGKVVLKLTSSGKMAVRVKSGHDPKYVQKIEKFANDYLSKYAKDIKK
jgi:hypothetical protein